jgi:hypothetical protein
MVLPVHGDIFQRKALSLLVEDCGYRSLLPSYGFEGGHEALPGIRFLGNPLQIGAGIGLAPSGAQERAVMARQGVACILLDLDTLGRRVRAAITVRGCIRADLHTLALDAMRDDCEAEILDMFTQGMLAVTALRKHVHQWAEREFQDRFGLSPLVLVSIFS